MRGVEGVRDRFFHEDRLARGERGQHRFQMPVFRGADDHAGDVGRRDEGVKIGMDCTPALGGDLAREVVIEVEDACQANAFDAAQEAGVATPHEAQPHDPQSDGIRHATPFLTSIAPAGSSPSSAKWQAASRPGSHSVRGGACSEQIGLAIGQRG
jgi:hypothetical protein